jgi:bis(5'-adenosyl)-triphosphatase
MSVNFTRFSCISNRRYSITVLSKFRSKIRRFHTLQQHLSHCLCVPRVSQSSSPAHYFSHRRLQQQLQHQNQIFCTNFTYPTTSSILSASNSARKFSFMSSSSNSTPLSAPATDAAVAAAAQSLSSDSDSLSATFHGFSTFPFGKVNLPAGQVFYVSPNKLCYASVNLKPVKDGHSLIIVRRPVERVHDLDPEELTEMWQSAQLVSRVLEQKFSCPSLTFAIQDGKDAGQTMPQVHIHIVPRCPDDFKHNDEVYEALESASQLARLHMENQHLPHLDLDNSREPRTLDEMVQEASEMRTQIAAYLKTQNAAGRYGHKSSNE